MANEELATAIRQVKSGKEFHFAMIAKSGNIQLTMEKRKIGGEAIALMKKASGGGPLLRDTCVMEDGTLFFMTSASASDAIASQLKKMIKEETGLTVNCGFRASAAADDDEEVESQDEAPSPAQAAPAKTSTPAPAKATPAGPAPTPAAPEPAPLSKRTLMVEFADLVKANAAKMKDQPEVAKLVRAIKAALDADKLADATTLIAALKRMVG
ncbi:hypothetical protein MCELHM10_01756 [Paracoccaceae bacterium]